MKILVTEEQAKLIFGKKYQCPKCEHTWDIEKKDKNYQLCHWCGWDDSEEKYNQNELLNFWKKESQKNYNELKKDEVTEKWSQKYKNSINCNNPKGFSQRAHCQGRKKRNNESYLTIENIIPTKKILDEIKLILESVTSGNPIKELIEGLLKKEAMNITQEETTFLKQFIKDVETQVDELVNGTKKLEELTNEELLNIFKRIHSEKPTTIADGILKQYNATYLPKIKLIPSSEAYKNYFEEILKKYTKENPNNPFLTSLNNFINTVETTYKNILELEKLNTYLDSALLKEDLSESAKKLLQDIKDQVEKQLDTLKYAEEMSNKIPPTPEIATLENTLSKLEVKTKQKLANGIRKIVKKIEGTIKTMDYKLTFGGGDNKILDEKGVLLPEVEKIIKDQDSNFINNVSNGKYSYLETNGKFDFLNKLDTNTKDRLELLKLYAKDIKGIQDIDKLTKEDYEKLIDDFIKDCDDPSESSKIKKLIEENKELLTTNIKKNSEEGAAIEQAFVNRIGNNEELGDAFEVVWKATSDGNPMDTIIGADMIVKRKSDNTYHLVQIKKSSDLKIKSSEMPDKVGQENISSMTFSDVRLKNGYVGLQDRQGKYVFYPPQDLYKLEKNADLKDYIPKNEKGFNKKYHRIDIDPTTIGDEIYTNLDLPNFKNTIK
jgi:hypothetical protein